MPTPAPWSVREASAEDAATLALVGSATFLETFAGVLERSAIVAHCRNHHSHDAYARLLAMGARAWIADADPGGAPVGYALLTAPDLAQATARDRELKRIYTLSRFHGSGLGATLLHEVVAAAIESGADRLLLGVYQGNARARGFYARHGFAPIGERRFRVGDRCYDDLVMAKPLR